MKTDNLIWYAAEKEEVPDVAFGAGNLLRRKSLLSPTSYSCETPVRVAFSRDNIAALDYRPPAVFMLRQGDAAETLSWLRVFAREAFPLSQFARVITDTDWDLIFSKPSDGLSTRSDKWSSVVLGEALAQGESEIGLESLPLSRANACFSAAIARANFIHDSYSATRACAERMRLIADDPRFVRRAVSIDTLVPIWVLVSANIEDTTDLRELVEIVLHAAEGIEDNPSNVALARNILNSNAQLFSDSAEERVVAFQRMASEAVANTARSGKTPATTAALLAVGAFLVGRSTSHAFLLRKFPMVASTAFVWFGLIAALRGVRGWDPHWLRLAKGIERQLRTSFDMQDPPAADICWTEYNWLSQSFSGTQGVSEIARLFPKTLSIEVVPGAVCQFRLSAESRAPQEVERRPDAARESEIRQTLEQFISLSSKARALLDSLAPKSPPTQGQSSLGFDETIPSSKSKPKKGYKRLDK
ncbi:MAG: hypothetical protein KA144_00645 [Xanthomonadaceae bacterium]|nr:hypothetical protein [Xanthomonadaceae bacterium]